MYYKNTVYTPNLKNRGTKILQKIFVSGKIMTNVKVKLISLCIRYKGEQNQMHRPEGHWNIVKIVFVFNKDNLEMDVSYNSIIFNR